MKKLFLIPSVCAILSSFSVADTYQSQVDFGYLDVEDVETTLI